MEEMEKNGVILEKYSICKLCDSQSEYIQNKIENKAKQKQMTKRKPLKASRGKDKTLTLKGAKITQTSNISTNMMGFR